MKRIPAFLVIALMFFSTSCAPARHGTAVSGNRDYQKQMLHDALPVDPAVRIGRLDNGLSYYIRQNHKPENRLELRLVVKAGSVLENDDQQGLAHFAEHMAFNGTKNFNRQELVDYLESIGMRFGPELNAYTGFDETVYVLEVPTDSLHVVEKAFQILEDWAHNVSYDDSEIDRERGVVIEEWRLGRGAGARMRDRQFPVILRDSRYAERLPIGKKDILEQFDHETLRSFYRDWYRPGLMAVIAVGDFPPESIESMIRQHFGGITPIPNPRERTVYPVPDHDQTLFAITSDPEATGSSISIYYKHPVEPFTTVGDYRSMLVRNLFIALFNARLDELTKQADPPFLAGYAVEGRFILSKEFFVLGATVRDNGIERGLETIAVESERVRKYGFTESELDRQKKELLMVIETQHRERDKTESGEYIEEYTGNFLMDEPIPGIEYEYELHKKLVPVIGIEDVNRLADRLITLHNRVIVVSAPEKEGVRVPEESDLLAILDSMENTPINPYVDSFREKPLIDRVFVPSTVTGRTTIEELGVTELTLENGIRIIMKPTDYKNDEILFTSFSPGGNSLVSIEDYIPAVTASNVVVESGVGDFNRIELTKLLTGKNVNVSPWIGELQEGISGSSIPDDLETMFQLVYLYFTAAREDTTAFIALQARMRGYVENRNLSPETAFEDTVMVTMAQHNPRVRPLTLGTVDDMNLERSEEVYHERFADAGDFTFFFVGNFEPDRLENLARAYLGNLPTLKRSETWRDTGITPPDGLITREVRRGLEQKSRVRLLFTGPFVWNRQNRYDLQSMADVLNIRLREVLREDMGGTYGVGVSASRSHYPREEYTITIGFGCDPERVDELTAAVFQQIDELKRNGPSETELTKVRETQRRTNETNLKQNSYWLSTLNFYYFHSEDPREILKLDMYVDNLTAGAIMKAAQTYFDMGNYVKVVLYPEK